MMKLLIINVMPQNKISHIITHVTLNIINGVVCLMGNGVHEYNPLLCQVFLKIQGAQCNVQPILHTIPTKSSPSLNMICFVLMCLKVSLVHYLTMINIIENIVIVIWMTNTLCMCSSPRTPKSYI